MLGQLPHWIPTVYNMQKRCSCISRSLFLARPEARTVGTWPSYIGTQIIWDLISINRYSGNVFVAEFYSGLTNIQDQTGSTVCGLALRPSHTFEAAFDAKPPCIQDELSGSYAILRGGLRRMRELLYLSALPLIQTPQTFVAREMLCQLVRIGHVRTMLWKRPLGFNS